MKAVAIEREKIRQRERARLKKEQKIGLRDSPKPLVQSIVDGLDLKKWVAQEDARLKLLQAGYRGQAGGSDANGNLQRDRLLQSQAMSLKCGTIIYAPF